MTSPTLLPSFACAAAAAALAGCGSTEQHMNLSTDSLLTPPHTMSYADYPFDPHGRYIDAWAVAGARRYGSRVDSDHQDHGREVRKKATAAKPGSSSSRPKTATPKPTSKPPAKARSHIVKSGDSLSSLSRRYGVSVQAIKNANALKSDLIRDGRKLVIPR